MVTGAIAMAMGGAVTILAGAALSGFAPGLAPLQGSFQWFKYSPCLSPAL